jgi:hypothetical protein
MGKVHCPLSVPAVLSSERGANLMRTVISAFLVIFLLLAYEANAADRMVPTDQMGLEDQQVMFIQIDQGRLTVKLWDAPIKMVLEEIERRTGIKIVILAALTQNISVEFEDLPLEEGVQRLLKNYGLGLVTAGGDKHPLEKVFVVEGVGSVRPGRRQVSPPPRKNQVARQKRFRAEQSAQAFASMLAKEQIKRYLEAFLKNPYMMPDIKLFSEAVKAVSAEELEPIIQMLEDENVRLSEYKSAMKPLKDTMGPLTRGSVIGHLQNPSVRTQVLDNLKAIHESKIGQKAKKK